MCSVNFMYLSSARRQVQGSSAVPRSVDPGETGGVLTTSEVTSMRS